MELKIGMYTEDEIFEYMTDCEGSMLGRSMYDAIFDKIHALITENEQLKEENRQLINNKYDAIDLIQDLACYEQDTHAYCDDINYYDVHKIVDTLEGNNE